MKTTTTQQHRSLPGRSGPLTQTLFRQQELCLISRRQATDEDIRAFQELVEGIVVRRRKVFRGDRT